MKSRIAALALGLLASSGFIAAEDKLRANAPELAREAELETAGTPVEFGRIACAIKCPKPQGLRRATSAAVVIFVGQVESVRNDTRTVDLTALGPIVENVEVIEFDVSMMLKGTMLDRAEVVTNWSGRCGFDFSVGGDYLVFAALTDDEFWTDPFKRTKPAQSAAKDIRKLKRRFDVQ